MYRSNSNPSMSWPRFVLALLVGLPLAGCEGVLEVTDPDIVTPDNLTSEIGLQTLRNGALGLFTTAYAGGGSTDGQIMATGLMTDEWLHSGTFPTRFQADVRSAQNDNGTLSGVYFRLQRARVALEDAAAKLDTLGSDPTNDERIGEMLAYAGFTYIAFGENYCEGVPYSFQPETGDTEFGQPTTRDETFDLAIARFDAAIAHPAVASDVADMARVGRGRVLLNQGNYAAAAAAVASVADGFVKVHRHSSNSSGQRNSIFELNVSFGRWSISDNEGINGLNFRSANDPRVQWALCPGCAFDTSEQVPGTPAVGDNWQHTNYTSRNDPVRLATGIEARLIETEADLRAGRTGNWLAKLNGLRAQWGSLASIVRGDATGTLAPLADPGTTTSREDLMFRERAFWLFSTGHRLGDLRRLVRQYGRNAGSVFPTGAYFKAGANYGTDVVLLISQEEENNPNFSECTNLSA